MHFKTNVPKISVIKEIFTDEHKKEEIFYKWAKIRRDFLQMSINKKIFYKDEEFKKIRTIWRDSHG